MAQNAPTNIATMDADLGAVLSEFGQSKKSLAAIAHWRFRSAALAPAGQAGLIFYPSGANCHARDM